MTILPTSLGTKALVFFATLVASFYAAPYLNLFFLLLVFLAMTGSLSAFWAWRNLAGTRVELLTLDPTAAGRSARATLQVDGGGRRRFELSCRVQLGKQKLTAAHATSLRGTTTVRGALPPLPRGVHALDAAWLESRYPFGFLRCRQPLPCPEPLVVYPAPADLGDATTRRQLIAQLSGDLAHAGAEDLGPSGLRDYRPGDEPRAVHWRATARRGDLIVAEWEGEGQAGIELCLDLRATLAELEDCLSTIAALALWAREHKEVLRLTAQDHTATYGECHQPWRELLAYLAAAQPAAPDAPPPPPVAPGTLRLPRRVAALGGPRA